MADRDVAAKFERYAKRFGSWIGGGAIGLALGVYVDPFLAIHHWPVIAQPLIPGIASAGGGMLGDVLAARVRTMRTRNAENQKRDELQGQIGTLREQITTVPDQAVAADLTGRLDRRVADWDMRVIKTATFERTFNEIREDYLSATGSAQTPARRRRREGTS